MTRRALDELDDLVYVLACAVEDVERETAGVLDDEDFRRNLEWLMQAARPLAVRSRAGKVFPP